MAQQATRARLYRSRNAFIAGVCAGIAERHDFDAIVIRILAVLLTIATFGLAALVYVAIWVSWPQEPEPTVPLDVTPEHVESSAFGEVDFSNLTNRSIYAEFEPGKLSVVARLAIAVGLMMLFLVVAFNVAPMVSGTQWWQFWPLGLLIVGLCLIVIPVRNRFETVWHVIGVATTSLAAMMLPISLGVIAWETLPLAFSQLWIFVFLAALLFVGGLYKNVDALLIAAACCIVAFCVLTLVMYALPGDVESLLVTMPDGRSLQIAMANS